MIIALLLQTFSASALFKHRHHHKKKKPKQNPLYVHQPQNGLGGITGKIMGDLQPVNGVTLVVMQKDRIIDKTTTDETGNYSFRYLAPGKYDLKAMNNDYRTVIITKIPITADESIKNSFYLPKFNNANMPHTPIVETFEEHIAHMRHYK